MKDSRQKQQNRKVRGREMELVIYDEYVESNKSKIENKLSKINEIIYAFKNIVENVCQSGVELGKTAEALEAFATYINILYSDGGFQVMADQVNVFCDNYLKNIDQIDGDLYD